MKNIKKMAIATSLIAVSMASVGFTFPNNINNINNIPIQELCIDDIGGQTDGSPMTKTNCGGGRVISREDSHVDEDRVSANKASEIIGTDEG